MSSETYMYTVQSNLDYLDFFMNINDHFKTLRGKRKIQKLFKVRKSVFTIAH